MKIGLFIPCYVDQFYPHVGMATVSVLEHFGVEVVFPTDQTCCGQPMANSGCMEEAKPLAKKFVEVMGGKFTMQSEVGVGTVITISLPKEVSPIHSMAPEAPAGDSPAAA